MAMRLGHRGFIGSAASGCGAFGVAPAEARLAAVALRSRNCPRKEEIENRNMNINRLIGG